MLTSVARLSTRASLGVAAFAAPLASSASALCGASIRPTQSSITAAPARFVSQENFKRMVRTTKHVMTDIPAPIVPVLVPQEVAADAEPTDVRFSHPMPAFFDAASPTTEIANNELFAVVDVNGRQFKVAAGDLIMADHIKGVVIGDQLSIDRVLLAGSRDFTVLGKPTVASARVLVTVEEQTKLAPRMVFHMRRRTGFHNLKRFADMITVLRVDAVELADAPAARPEAEIAPAVPVRGGATATPILVRGRTKSTLVIGTAHTNAPAAAEAGAQ